VRGNYSLRESNDALPRRNKVERREGGPLPPFNLQPAPMLQKRQGRSPRHILPISPGPQGVKTARCFPCSSRCVERLSSPSGPRRVATTLLRKVHDHTRIRLKPLGCSNIAGGWLFDDRICYWSSQCPGFRLAFPLHSMVHRWGAKQLYTSWTFLPLRVAHLAGYNSLQNTQSRSCLRWAIQAKVT